MANRLHRDQGPGHRKVGQARLAAAALAFLLATPAHADIAEDVDSDIHLAATDADSAPLPNSREDDAPSIADAADGCTVRAPATSLSFADLSPASLPGTPQGQ